jgi:hypothetical protein
MAIREELIRFGNFTLRPILQLHGTEEQLAILARADLLYVNKTGRYYGGHVSDEEVNILLPPPVERHR